MHKSEKHNAIAALLSLLIEVSYLLKKIVKNACAFSSAFWTMFRYQKTSCGFLILRFCFAFHDVKSSCILHVWVHANAVLLVSLWNHCITFKNFIFLTPSAISHDQNLGNKTVLRSKRCFFLFVVFKFGADNVV